MLFFLGCINYQSIARLHRQMHNPRIIIFPHIGCVCTVKQNRIGNLCQGSAGYGVSCWAVEIVKCFICQFCVLDQEGYTYYTLQLNGSVTQEWQYLSSVESKLNNIFVWFMSQYTVNIPKRYSKGNSIHLHFQNMLFC